MKTTYYFSHDFNVRTDKKIKLLLKRFGWHGYGLFWAIVEDLYNNANALPLDYESIAFDLRTDDIAMLKSIINDFELFENDGCIFWSNSVQRRLDEREERSVKARKSAHIRWENANAMQTHSDGNAIKEKKVKKIKEIKVLLDVRITYYSLICVNSFSSVWKLPHLALQRSILIANIIPGGFGILGSCTASFHRVAISLGLQPKTTKEYIEQELNDWADLGVEGHFHAKNQWFPYHEFLRDASAQLVGALPLEVVVMNQLTVNLHLMLISFYRPTAERYKIIFEKNPFPSDRYAFQSQAFFHGFDIGDALIELEPRSGEYMLRTEDIIKTIEEHDESIALVCLGGVNYYTGQLFDLKNITLAAHKAGAVCGFDLAHAAGNVNLELHKWNVDFAVWCSYKYLNSEIGRAHV